jgi:hypothetical protein
MTDAAGSLTREMADELGVILLDSYVNLGASSLPETYADPAAVFKAMRDGTKASTSQAADEERRQCYRKAADLHDRVLYISVGSYFTGNYQSALDWKAADDKEDRLTVMDSGSASGRLGLAVIAAARRALETNDPEEVMDYARRAVDNCREYIFLDKLQYLAAGGRLSRTSAFFGELLKMKPVVSPRPTGAEKVGVVRSREEGVEFALKRLDEELPADRPSFIMLEYTDNEGWLRREVLPRVSGRHPQAEVLFCPISLTTGVHVGPGGWGAAFLPLGD